MHVQCAGNLVPYRVMTADVQIKRVCKAQKSVKYASQCRFYSRTSSHICRKFMAALYSFGKCFNLAKDVSQHADHYLIMKSAGH